MHNVSGNLGLSCSYTKGWSLPAPPHPPISETTYAYDGIARITEMRYPNGWVEYYTYDKLGRLLAVDDTHPSEKPAKNQKRT